MNERRLGYDDAHATEILHLGVGRGCVSLLVRGDAQHREVRAWFGERVLGPYGHATVGFDLGHHRVFTRAFEIPLCLHDDSRFRRRLGYCAELYGLPDLHIRAHATIRLDAHHRLHAFALAHCGRHGHLPIDHLVFGALWRSDVLLDPGDEIAQRLLQNALVADDATYHSRYQSSKCGPSMAFTRVRYRSALDGEAASPHNACITMTLPWNRPLCVAPPDCSSWTRKQPVLRIERLAVRALVLVPGAIFRSRNLMAVISLCGEIDAVIDLDFIAGPERRHRIEVPSAETDHHEITYHADDITGLNGPLGPVVVYQRLFAFTPRTLSPA